MDIADLERRPVRIFPYHSSPRIEARFVGGKLQIPETYKAIDRTLVARAASLGFHEIERSRYHFSRIIGELTETLRNSDELLSEDTLTLPFLDWIDDARREAAVQYLNDAIRDSMLESGNFRRARFFAWGDEGPTSCVSWLRSSGVETMVESICRHVRLAAAFHLKFSWAVPAFESESHWIALEIHKPGRSILDGWRFGDTTYYCDFDLDDPSSDPEAA